MNQGVLDVEELKNELQLEYDCNNSKYAQVVDDDEEHALAATSDTKFKFKKTFKGKCYKCGKSKSSTRSFILGVLQLAPETPFGLNV